jgi:hypothetical protein
MKTKYKDYIIRVYFWGDRTTPMYEYSLYKPRRYWFSRRVWRQSIHGSDIAGKISDEFDAVIDSYLSEQERWKFN